MKAAPPAVIDARLDWHAELEREIKLYDSHPELDAWRPQFHGALDASGWRGLLMEDLGQSFRPPPWTDAMTHRVAIGLARMHGETRRGGDCVIHGDVRSDNLFLVRDRGLMLCDWAEARWGSPVEDAAYWAVGVECEGGELASDAYARYVAAAEELQASTLVPILRQLALLNQRRVERLSEPDRVRRLRQHELAAMRNWLSSEGGNDASGVWTGSQQPPTTICSTKPTLASGENQDQVGPVSGEKSDQHSPGQGRRRIHPPAEVEHLLDDIDERPGRER